MAREKVAERVVVVVPVVVVPVVVVLGPGTQIRLRRGVPVMMTILAGRQEAADTAVAGKVAAGKVAAGIAARRLKICHKMKFRSRSNLD